MRQFAALIALALSLAGCAGQNRIENPADSATVPPERGVVILGLDRSGTLDGTPFVADLRAVDPSGRIDAARLDPNNPRRASAVLEPRSIFANRSQPYQAFALEPGEYALASVSVGPQSTSTYYSYPQVTGGGGGGGALIGLAALLVIGAAVAIAANANEGADGPPERPPLLYVQENVAVAEAPRFHVRAGEVLYLGDILIGVERRTYRVDDPAFRSGPNKYDTTKNWTIGDTRLFAEYALDEREARRHAASLNLGNRPFRVQPLRLSDRPLTMFANYRDPDPKTHVLVGATTLARARPHLPVAADPPRLAAPDQPRPGVPVSPAGTGTPTASPQRPVDLDGLMRQFLEGKISKAEYDAARTRLSAGS